MLEDSRLNMVGLRSSQVTMAKLLLLLLLLVNKAMANLVLNNLNMVRKAIQSCW